MRLAPRKAGQASWQGRSGFEPTCALLRPGSEPGGFDHSPTPHRSCSTTKLAERQGFEPWCRYRLCLSKTAHLAALPPLLELQKACLAQLLHEVLLLGAATRSSCSCFFIAKLFVGGPWGSSTPSHRVQAGATTHQSLGPETFNRTERQTADSMQSLARPLHTEYAVCCRYPFIRTPENGVAKHAQAPGQIFQMPW